jgi:hypothetical protein
VDFSEFGEYVNLNPNNYVYPVYVVKENDLLVEIKFTYCSSPYPVFGPTDWSNSLPVGCL